MKVLGQPLEAILKLCDAATEGPWGMTFKHGHKAVREYPWRQADRDFIAQSRTLLPALVAKLLEAERWENEARRLLTVAGVSWFGEMGDDALSKEIRAFLETDA